MSTLASTTCSAKLCAAVLALSYACIALGASTSAGFTVTVTVLPTRAQILKVAQLSLRQPDGSVLVLNSQQQVQYIDNPANLTQYVRGTSAQQAVLTVEY